MARVAPDRQKGTTLALQNDILDQIRFPLRLTWAGLWCERLAKAFWPLWSIVIAALSALAFGVQDWLPLEAAWIGLMSILAGAVWALVYGLSRFRRPRRTDALERLDNTLPGHPISALTDTQAIGIGDPASAAVWEAHRARMAARAAQARPVSPDLRLARRDPYALRYVALTALVIALMFGSLWRVTSVTGLTPGGSASLASGPVWEGWAQPPAYTGKPSLYLNDITAEDLTLPVGTRVLIRLYGDVGALTLAETVSGRTDPQPASSPSQDFSVTRSGKIGIDGPGGREWDIRALPDAPPTVSPSGEMTRGPKGQLQQAFQANDDYGVAAGRTTIALDLAAVDRRFGLATDPEPRDPVVLDLPLPISGNRKEFTETLVDDLSKHAFANLPVTVTLSVTDASGQTGTSEPIKTVLPGKRFFDPLAAALIELRRDLLWNRTNAPDTAQILKAVTYKPEGFIRSEKAYLKLRVLTRDLDAQAATLSTEARDQMADALWDIALLIEEGDLASALARLQRAQDRLDEAIRNGADKSEIDELMAEMKDALNEYMRQLAQQSPQNGDQQSAQQMQGLQMSADQLQQMLDKLQELMEQGKTAEAQQLMEALRQLMQNMQVVQGEGSSGGQGNMPMQGLADMLREQQKLSDDSFRQLQDQFSSQLGQGGQGGQQGEGDGPGSGQKPGQSGQGESQPDGRSLAERQGDLGDRLGKLQNLPGAGSDAGEEGRRQLDRAGRAMDDAEQALRDGDLSGALDKQAEAMDAMREGMRNLGDALAEEQGRQPGERQGGDQIGQADPNSQRDPLGRNTGQVGRIGSDHNMLQGEDVYRRAQELLDEIRRRSGDQNRPESELDYLRRLLERF